jgi:hypothetical protein
MTEAVKFASVPKMEKLESEITRLTAELVALRELLERVVDMGYIAFDDPRKCEEGLFKDIRLVLGMDDNCVPDNQRGIE